MGNATKSVALGLGPVADRFRTVVVQGDGTYCSRTCGHFELQGKSRDTSFCRRYGQFLEWYAPIRVKSQTVRCEQCYTDPEVIEANVRR